MLELVLYTTLWISDLHCNYKIYYCPLGKKYVFKPSKASIPQPLFEVPKQNGQWVFKNMTDPAVQQQAIEDIENISRMKNVPLL